MTCVLCARAGRAQEEQPVKDDVTITVMPGARQTFAGFGASLGNWGRDYQKLSPADRERLGTFLWGGLKLKSLRLWINLNEYVPTPKQRLIKEFRERYIDSGIIADAQKQGVVDLLLAPDNCPPALKVRRGTNPQDFAINDDRLAAYTDLIAEFIQQVRDETGVLINITGLQNEPNDLDRIAPEQMPAAVKLLRKALNARGLKSVRIIAPENGQVDQVLYDALGHLRADAEAWQALDGIASHSYSMAATDEAAQFVGGKVGANTKAYWMTEASDNGPESPGDTLRAASLASRFLNDMNHRTTHWIHFLGFEVADPKDNATRIIAFTTIPARSTIYQKYYYYQQLSNAFDVGSVFRDSESSLEGDMKWTYGKKPRLTAAAARNPDGSWAIGLSNFTATAFTEAPQDHSGHADGYPARTFAVTLKMPELADSGEIKFEVHRSSSHAGSVSEGNLTMSNGELQVTVGPLELVTLRVLVAD